MTDFITELVNNYPQVKEYQDKIIDVIVKSGCKNIEFADFKYPALGVALHDGVLINRKLLGQPISYVLFVIFHELGHQYQFKKYGQDQMYDCYLGDMSITEAVQFMRSVEYVADEFAFRKVREFIKFGHLIPGFIPPRVYKNTSDDKIISMIVNFREEFVNNNVTTPDGISMLVNKMIKEDEKVN